MPHAQTPDRLVEWMFALMMVSWGAWLVNPASLTFASPVYAPLAQLFPETVWGAFSAALGALRMAALLVNGRSRRTPVLRIACAILGMTWWLVLIVLATRAGRLDLPAEFSWFVVFAVFEALSCWRAAGDAYHADAFRRFAAPALVRAGT
jgi:hypothetical protein